MVSNPLCFFFKLYLFINLEIYMPPLSLSLTCRLNKNCISREGVECLIEALKMNSSIKEVW